ncbi:MAG: gamma-glutamyltransferase [Gemmatimonadetes bacterium]|nr:gamma-glutamyltransferase [Gemmatimonadota bacterium]
MDSYFRNLLVLPLVTGVVVSCAADNRRTPEAGRDAQGTHGVVTSDHRLATEAGLKVLQQGGNAMDAAITAAAVLNVARPHMNGMGGDMFLLYFEASSAKVYALNASGPSGNLAIIERVRKAGNKEMPAIGAMSVSVPGATRGWAAALKRFGTISWSQALEPAVTLARQGLPVSERLSLDIAEQVKKLRADPEAARIYLPGDTAPKPGAILRQDDLAATLARVQANGPDEVYTGETARRIVGHLKGRGGFLELRDLAEYQPEWTEPISVEYRGLTVEAFPPNTQGVTLLEELALLREIDLKTLGQNSPDYLHTIAEAIRIAVTDRDTSVADPKFMRISVAQLLDPDRLRRLAAAIDPKGSAPDGKVALALDHPNTVYIITADEQGNVVSMIQSLYEAFGSGIVVPRTGVVLHNRGSLFSLDSRHPNVLAPRKRPYHTLCPVLALKDGKPWLAFGTPGGDGQTHTNLQVLNNILLFGMTPQEAIDAPRLRRMPDGSLSIEDRVPESVRAALAQRGYHVVAKTGWTAEFGGAQAVLLDPLAGTKRAGADRRREAFAGAY